MKINKKVVFVSSVVVLFVVGLTFIFLLSGDKVNKDKKIQGLVIQNSEIKFNESVLVSFLSANVKNSSKQMKEDVRLKIIFLDKSKKEITSVIGFLGDVEVGQTRELNAAVSMELNDVHDIKYEIVE